MEKKSHKDLVAYMKSLSINLPDEIVRVLSDEAVKDEEAEVHTDRSQVLRGAPFHGHGDVVPPRKRMRVKTKITPRTDFQHDDEDVPRAKRSKKFDADKNASHFGIGIAAVGLCTFGLHG